MGALIRAATQAVRAGVRALPRVPGKTARAVPAVAVTAVAGDVAFTGGELFVAPIVRNVGEVTGRSTAAFGGGLVKGTGDELLKALDDNGRDNGDGSTFIIAGILVVIAVVLLNR